MRTILSDVDRVLGSVAYRAWAALHKADAQKVTLERGSATVPPQRRPLAGDPYARCLIEAIRVGIEWETPPAPLSLRELGRNIMFTAQNPEAALRCPPHWRIAVSADPAFDQAVRVAAPKIKQAGHLLAVWGVQTQIGSARIVDLAHDLQADLTIFQAETVEEYDTALAAGATIIVGNPNAWTATQRGDAIRRGDKLATLFEVYANAGSPWPDTASAQGVPVTSEVVGVGSWANGPDYQLRDYLSRTPPTVWASISVYYAEGMSEDSWGLLP